MLIKKHNNLSCLSTFVKLILLLALITYTNQDCAKMTVTNFQRSNFISGGSGDVNSMSIATREQEGSLWYASRALRIYPKFELQTTVRIPDDGCWDPFWSWAMDGFTIVFTQTRPPYTSGSGGYLGYNNIYNALVIEVDLSYNSEFGDLSSNSLSLHRCYARNCSPHEGSNTIQRQLPINYDKCSTMRYTLNIQYTPGNLNIYWGNGVLLLSSNEELFDKFKGWAHVGYTGFFRGSYKKLYVENSYFCEDTISGDMQFKFEKSNTKEITTPAGTTNTLFVSFKDPFGYIMPHFYGLNLIDWSISIDPECGDARLGNDDSAFDIGFDIFGCTKAGTYYVRTSYYSTNIAEAYLPKYTIVARAFEKNTISPPDGLAIKNLTGNYFLVQSNSNSFALDLINKNVISFSMVITDTYNNPFSLDAKTYLNDLAFTCIKTDGTPAPIVITNKSNFSTFQVDVKITSPGLYKVSANKMMSFYIRVTSGKPVAANSYCTIDSDDRQIYVGTEVAYTCYLLDINKNPLSLEDVQDTYKTEFSCTVTRNYLSQTSSNNVYAVPNANRTAFMYISY